jgi:hypothetical protein
MISGKEREMPGSLTRSLSGTVAEKRSEAAIQAPFRNRGPGRSEPLSTLIDKTMPDHITTIENSFIAYTCVRTKVGIQV